MSYVSVPDFLVTAIAYLHVISAMSWLGGGILFLSAVAPSIRRMSPAASLEFFARAVPRLSSFFLLAATSTVVFGPSLFLTISNFSPYIYVGVLTGLGAYLVMWVDFYHFGKVARLAREKLESGQAGPPPPELQKALRQGGLGVIITVILLVVTLMFMIYSGYPF